MKPGFSSSYDEKNPLTKSNERRMQVVVSNLFTGYEKSFSAQKAADNHSYLTMK